jgi:hypothetical protein
VLALGDGDDEGVLRRPGPDGSSALDHADVAGRDLAVLADAVARTLVEEHPTLHPAVLDEAARVYPHGLEASPEAALDLLTLEATALADRVEHVPAESWGRTAAVPGAGDATVLDLLREAVRSVAAHLHAAEQARGF